jgi:hypothetical protein
MQRVCSASLPAVYVNAAAIMVYFRIRCGFEPRALRFVSFAVFSGLRGGGPHIILKNCAMSARETVVCWN